MKIIIAGSEKSGKTELLTHFQTGPVEQAIEAVNITLLSIEYESRNIPCQFWDTSGNEKLKSAQTPYFKAADIYCYFIDLTKTIDPQKIEEDMLKDLGIINNENVKIILIGTKADDSQAKIYEFKQLQLKNIKIYDRMITSSRNNFATSANDDSILSTIKVFFTQLLKKILQENPTLLPSQSPNTNDTAGNFPDSYRDIWQAAGNETQAVTALLKDYSKTSGAPGFFETLKSTAHLIVSCHLLRNHHKAVAATLLQNASTPTEILTNLQQNLISKGNPINEDGSLAKRIRFIQKELNLSVINIDELNDTINENKTPGCCF